MPIDPTLKTIIDNASHLSSVAAEAVEQELAFRKKTEEELWSVLFSLQETVDNMEQNIDAMPFQDQVTAKLNRDLTLTETLNETILAKYKPSEGTITYPLKCNKMTEAIIGALGLMSKKFSAILDGSIINYGYEYHSQADDITVLGENNDNIYGCSKGTFLKTAALTMYLVANQKTHLYQADFSPLVEHSSWVDASSMVHVTPLPEGIDLRAYSELHDNEPNYNEYTYIFDNYTASKQGFVSVHSGYAFGGHRNEPRYPRGKLFGPEDCSSWVAKIFKCPVQFSTYDQLYYYRNRLINLREKPEGRAPSEEWINSTANVEMTRLFDVVKVRDPQQDIKAGQIYFHRVFSFKDQNGEDRKDINIEDLYNSDGSSGHTAVILGFKSDAENSKIITMAYSRDMPKLEGFGIQEFDMLPTSVDPARSVKNKKQVAILKPKL